VGRVWASAVVVLLGIGVLAGCGDDEEAVVITQAAYDEEAERLCTQHGESLARAYSDVRADSDAEEASLYTTEFIPRGRALINRLHEFGLPPDKAEEYTAGFNEALAALGAIEAEPYRYIDMRHARELTPEEDYVNRFRAGLAAADVPC